MRSKSMKRIYLVDLTIVLVVLGLLTYLWIDWKRMGEPIDSYKSVAVYYNSMWAESTHGNNVSADGYYYGQKWQCVEFVKRFYAQAKGHKMPEVYGNARDFFDPTLPQGARNRSRNLLQYRNGGMVKPQPDDLLVFRDPGVGHVAIITKVLPDAIEVIQQNNGWRTRESFPMTTTNHCYIIGQERKPSGWLRKTGSGATDEKQPNKEVTAH